MMAVKRSSGVAPEVNLRNSLHADNKAGKQGIHPGFETQGKCHHKSKTGISMALQKGLMSSIFFKKIKIKNLNIASFQMHCMG